MFLNHSDTPSLMFAVPLVDSPTSSIKTTEANTSLQPIASSSSNSQVSLPDSSPVDSRATGANVGVQSAVKDTSMWFQRAVNTVKILRFITLNDSQVSLKFLENQYRNF